MAARRSESAVNYGLRAADSASRTLGHIGGANAASDTALASLCLLGAGFDHKMPSKFQPTVAKHLTWLQANTSDSNSAIRIPTDMSTTTQALIGSVFTEAYGLTLDPNIKDHTEKYIQYLITQQLPDGSWGANPGDTATDALSTAYATMALKSAAATGLNVTDARSKIKTWITTQLTTYTTASRKHRLHHRICITSHRRFAHRHEKSHSRNHTHPTP